MTALSAELEQLLAGKGLEQVGDWVLRIMQTMHQGIIVLDTAGAVLVFNDFMRARYGWTDEERGRNVFVDRPLLVEQGLQEQFQRLVQTGDPLEAMAIRNLTHQGEEVYQNFWAYPLLTDGRTVGIVVQVEDVTETVRLAQELARVKDYLGDIVHSTRDAILVLDDRGRVSFANDMAWQICGYRPEDVLGHPALSFVLPAERQEVAAAGRRLMETGVPGYLETQLRLADGRYLDVGLTYARLRSGSDTIVIALDITERKRLERALRSRNHELSALSTIASTVSRTLDLDELLHLALDTVLDLVSADTGSVFLSDQRGEPEETDEPTLLELQVSLTRAEAPSLDLDPRWMRRVMQTGRQVVTSEMDSEPALRQVAMDAGSRSVAVVPLAARGKTQGLLAVASHRSHAFDEEGRSLLVAIGHQIGVAVENARLFAKAQRQLESMNRLFAASQVLTSTLDLKQVLELVIAGAARAIPAAERGAVALYDRDRDELQVSAMRGYESPAILGFRFPADRGYAGWALQHRQPIRVEDIATDPRAHLNTDWPEIRALRSAIAVPLIARDEVIGVLDLASVTRLAAFTEDDLQLLAAFANQAAVAIDNARLFQEAQRRMAELSTLTQIGRAISAALDQDQLLELIYQQVSLVMDTTNFFIALYDQETDTVRFPLAVEGNVHVEDRPDYAPRQAGHGLTEHVIQTRSPLLLRREGPYQTADIDLIGPPSRSWLGVPMMMGGRVLGVITVQNYDREGVYDTGHLILLSTIAGQAAVATENARLYAQARRAEELAALNQISTLITSSLDSRQVLDTIVSAIVRVMHCQKAAIFIRDEAEESIRLMSAHGLSERYVQQSQNISLRDVRAAATQAGQVLAVEDVRAEATAEGFRVLALEEGFLSLLDTPLRGRDRILGSLAAYYSDPRRFSKDEIELMSTFANHAVVAIENARLYASTDERLRERVTELVVLQQVSLRLTGTLELPTVLNTIAEAALRLVEASDIHIFLVEPSTGEFVFGAGLWDSGERNRLAAMPRKEGITAITAREGRRVVIDDAESHALYSTPEARAWGLKAIASFPLKRADRVVGVFNIAFLHAHQFSEDELRVLQLLADQAAIAVENARLYEEAQRLSITDGLTGLYNSRHFYAVLKKEMARIIRYDHTLSLAMMDIDNFKLYNDTYGHLAGDDLLQDLARLLRSQIRESDLAFRYGGEEFALLLPETEKVAAATLAERVRASLAAHQFIVKETGAYSHITMSMGVSVYPFDASGARDFVHAADMALYAAKAAGKNRVRVHNLPWLGPHELNGSP